MGTTSPTAEPRHAISADGTPIAYWTSGAGPPLLLVHGAMSDHQRWRILPQFEPYRTVHAMDRRGRGGSGDNPPWSLEREVEDIVAVVETLACDSGDDVDVLGHSFGGYLSLRAAARSDQVRRLAVYEPPVNDPARPEIAGRMQALVDAGQPDEAVRLMMREVVRMTDDEIDALQALPSWAARVSTAPTLPREMAAEFAFDPAEVARASQPTLVLAGGDSPDSVQEATRTVLASLPHAHLVVLEGQQHVADQLAPEEFSDAVLRFLRADMP